LTQNLEPEKLKDTAVHINNCPLLYMLLNSQWRVACLLF